MNYSVQEYIQKQSTDFLILFVSQCIQGYYGYDYDYILPYVLRILVQREDFKTLAIQQLNSNINL